MSGEGAHRPNGHTRGPGAGAEARSPERPRRLWIKICGCRAPEDAAAAGAAGADAFGLVLAPGFRRTLTLDGARRIREAAPAGLQAIGIFLGQPAAEIAAAAANLALDGVQVHGDVAEEAVRRLRDRLLVIRAWDLEGPEPGACDFLHLEPGAAAGGGTGRAWDWARAMARRPSRPFILSGGLTPETVAAACAAARPDGVDVSSGVETGGRKDPEKIARFCAEARRWRDAAGGEGRGGGRP